MSTTAKFILFSDLDGTLLDRTTYSFKESLEALRQLQAYSVIIVFCSSKTRIEQEHLRQIIGIDDPFIVENGSAIIFPPNAPTPQIQVTEQDGKQVVVLGVTFQYIWEALREIREETHLTFQSYHDLTAEKTAQITGLNFEAAKRARNREYSETIVTQLTQKEFNIFDSACQRRNLSAIRGTRFITVTGRGANKGQAVKLLLTAYKKRYEAVTTFAIGDSLNDAPLLKAADYPYLVQRPDKSWIHITANNLQYVSAVGPQGFIHMVDDIEKRWLRPSKSH